MRTFVLSVVVLCMIALIAGCATPYPLGQLYTQVTMPVAASSASSESSKVGSSECMSVLGLVAIGDASIKTAKRDGNITTIHLLTGK